MANLNFTFYNLGFFKKSNSKISKKQLRIWMITHNAKQETSNSLIEKRNQYKLYKVLTLLQVKTIQFLVGSR